MAKYLAIGSAINVLLVVAIAWCVPEPIGPPDSVRQLGKEEAQAWPGPVEKPWPTSPWSAFDSELSEWNSRDDDSNVVEEHRNHGVFRSTVAIETAAADMANYEYMVHHLGFPFRATRYDSFNLLWWMDFTDPIRDKVMPSNIVYSGFALPVARMGVRVHGRYQHLPPWLDPLLPKSPRALPLMPLLRGMVMNAIVWATTAWAFVSLARRRWRHRRSRRGLCVACAYLVRGFSSCPECGRAVIE